jgi:Ca2+/Na+ antiporter
MKKVIFGVLGICIIVLGMYFPIVWWIIGIAVLLIVVLFVWLISGSDKRKEESMIDKFGRDYKDAISKGKLGLRTPYPCTPDAYYTSKNRIEEIAKISLPEFSIKECKETLEDFTGDYSGEATIEFNEPIGDSVIMQIVEAMKQKPSKWRMKAGDVYECILAEPDLATKPRNDIFWIITLQLDSTIGKIIYGRV